MNRMRPTRWVQAAALGCACLFAPIAWTPAWAQATAPRYTLSTLTDAISLDTQEPLPLLWEEVPWLDSQDRVLGMRKQLNAFGAAFGALVGLGDGMATSARPGAWAPVAAGSPPAAVKPSNLSNTGTLSELLAISPDGQWTVVYERGLAPYLRVMHGSVSVRVQPPSGSRVFLGAINNQGLAGGCLDNIKTGLRTPVLWQQGSYTRLPTGEQPSGMVYSVNNAGAATGKVMPADQMGQRAARWTGGQLQVLSGDQVAGSRGEHINERGTVALVYAMPGDAQIMRVGLWRGDQLTPLPEMRTLAALNNADEVLGQSTEGEARAALWRNGQQLDLTRELQAQGLLPSTARAYLGRSINDNGSVVLDVGDNNKYSTVRAAAQRP